jgi:E3 ubiquitin-protein ligase RNF14
VAEYAFLDEYLVAQEGSPVRVYLERLHGKGNLARLIRAHQEERANAAWLDGRSSGSIASQVCLLISDAETTSCPSCHVHIEKSAGCDHVCSLFGAAYCVTYGQRQMICLRCSHHFCYLCGKELDEVKHYEHFGGYGGEYAIPLPEITCSTILNGRMFG